MISTHRHLKRGFSLIEVAIALAIFVIGALAIIRIFPGALNVINNNGDQLVANNYNRSVLARLQSEKVVPDATFNLKRTSAGDVVWTTSNTANHSNDWESNSTSVAGVPRFNLSLPSNAADINEVKNSALGHYRGIQGEPAQVFTIGESPAFSAGVQYALTQFPISIAPQGIPAVIAPLKPTVSQDYNLENVTVKSDGTLDFSKMKPITGMLYAANTNSMLYVSYRYKNSAGKIWGIQEEPVPVFTGIDLRTAVTLKVRPPGTGLGAIGDPINGVVAEFVDVRLRQYLGEGLVGPSPPLGDPEQQAAAAISDARRGLVRLPGNINTANNKPVILDYVADWSFLVQTGVPTLVPEPVEGAAFPANNYRQIALGAPFIEDQADIGIYSLLLQPNPNPGDQNAPQNEAKYIAYKSSFGTLNPNPSPTFGLVTPDEGDLRAGRATFALPDTPADDAPTPSRISDESLARVTYQTRDSWAQQISVAARAYKPYAVSNIPGTAASIAIEPWRDYVLVVNGTGTYLYFHAGDAGKSLNISYSYTTGAVDATTGLPLPDIKVVSRPYILREDLVGAAGLGLPTGFAASTEKVAIVELLTIDGQSFSNPVNLTSIQGVRGTSATVRTAYLNGGRYTQSLLSTNVSRSVN